MKITPRIELLNQPAPPRQDASGLVLGQVPSDAFGDGSHPTTRLCASIVDLYCRQQKPSRVLDVGTGTGLLARIARAHGSNFVVGTDISPSALKSAEANAALDGGGISFRAAAPDSWGPHFDFVIANILEEILKELAPALVNAVAPGGALLLSGFTPLQAPSLKVAFGRMTLESESVLDGWCALLFRAGIPGEHC